MVNVFIYTVKHSEIRQAILRTISFGRIKPVAPVHKGSKVAWSDQSKSSKSQEEAENQE